ncbi:MAG: hypothetical protein ACE15B_15015 [Bryobacteraceae bacterium]
MTDLELEHYLRENGYPEHICRAGRAGLIALWKQFVKEVEKGYRRSLEDYRNDLDVRALISQENLDAQVADEDARLERLLVNRDIRVWESSPGNPFWDFGYPKNAAGDLLEDLRAEGLEQ